MSRRRHRRPAESELFPAGMDGLTARFVELRSGVRVRVVECAPQRSREGGGGGGDGGSETAVFLPGWGCSAYAFRKNLGALAARGVRAVAVELKGQGASDKPVGAGEYTSDSLTAHVLDVLDALMLEKASLVGLSLGGLLAASVALAAPERVTQLALLDPVGFGRVRLVGLARRLPAGLGPFISRVAGQRWLFALALRGAYGSLGKPSARDVDEYFAPARDPAFLRSLWSLLHEVDWRMLTAEELQRLTMPLLVVFGTRDRLISPRDAERLAGEAPDARTIFIPGAGHASPEEAPDAVNTALGDFLAG